jgi:hypothetical protein
MNCPRNYERNHERARVYPESLRRNRRDDFQSIFGEFTSAHGDLEAEQGAKERFRKGIVHAQHVRDLPLTLVP